MKKMNRSLLSIGLFAMGIALTLLVQAAEVKVTEYRTKTQWNPAKNEVSKLIHKTNKTKKINLAHLSQF